ncbi:hypothetical protein PInf_006607 [Phytophthora infestans]|nr:hypothetical protein PInf_006607 [Phytophthora infestans]
MDPNHVDCYTQAQVELRELFHDLECNGQVSAAELQQSLVPFTAGDVKRDLLQLLSDLKRKRQSLDEHEFLRVMWRKMYLASAIEATKSGAAGEHRHINVSLAHVIVSVKRRQQLRQFASYYSSRGISGADHLTSSTRATTSMRTRTLLTRARGAEVRNCSQLYCLLFTKEAGNFVLASTHFGENAKRNYIKEKDEVGLRNVVAAASSRASFAASTGRKLHQWRAQEPYRVLEDADSETLVHQQLNISDTNNEGDDEENQLTSAGVRLLDTDPPGDCFGLLGGKPLLARTKTIADVGDLRQIAAGEHFLMATSSSGELYSWESSSSSTAPPIGRGYVIPERVPWFHSPEKVFRVACGSHHTLVLTSSGVYAWGSNVYGQLGLGAHCSPADPHTLEPAPVRIPTDDMPVLDIACGDMHSVALTAGGQVFTFGCNWEGQLGFNEQSNAKIADVVATGCAYEPLPVLLPQEPDIDKKVYLITAGPQTTAVVGTSGRVFQWGRCVPDGLDGVCGRVSRRLPESLDAVSEYEGTSGPVWHSIAIADGLVTLTRHATATSAVSEDPTALKR